MMQKTIFAFFLSTLFLFIGCRKDPVEPNLFDRGILIVNEGLFQTGNGTLSWIDIKTEQVSHEVYSTANDGLLLGNIAQSATYDKDHFYIAINNAARVVVTDRKSMKFKYEIQGVQQPRFVQAAEGDQLYVSAWGDGFDGAFHIYNSKTGQSIYTISGLKGPEEFFISETEILVPASGGFGNHNVIYRIDKVNGILIDSFVVADRPVKIVGIGGVPYLICSGKFDFTDPNNNTPGALYRIDQDQAVFVTELPNGVRNLVYMKENTSLYFVNGNRLGQYQISNGSIYYHNMSISTPNGLYSAIWNGKMYLVLSDAKDFVSTGEVHILDLSGNTLKQYSSGLIPGYILSVE
ncbi:hypothetical protein BH23THE1_BH23THE1_11490 [soil metagenome]